MWDHTDHFTNTFSLPVPKNHTAAITYLQFKFWSAFLYCFGLSLRHGWPSQPLLRSWFLLWLWTLFDDLDLQTWPRQGQGEGEPACQCLDQKSFNSKVIVHTHRHITDKHIYTYLTDCSTRATKVVGKSWRNRQKQIYISLTEIIRQLLISDCAKQETKIPKITVASKTAVFATCRMISFPHFYNFTTYVKVTLQLLKNWRSHRLTAV